MNFNGLTLDGNKIQATSNVTKLTKIKSVIISNQSKNWQLELTLIPNGPIKLGLYQNGILLEEGIVSKF
jgi:hypothetical protein